MNATPLVPLFTAKCGCQIHMSVFCVSFLPSSGRSCRKCHINVTVMSFWCFISFLYHIVTLTLKTRRSFRGMVDGWQVCVPPPWGIRFFCVILCPGPAAFPVQRCRWSRPGDGSCPQGDPDLSGLSLEPEMELFCSALGDDAPRFLLFPPGW